MLNLTIDFEVASIIGSDAALTPSVEDKLFECIH